MRLQRLTLAAYGRCRDVGIEIGEGVTIVLGANEAGKSTALDALSDLLWGIPRNTARTSEFTRSELRIDAVLEVDGASRTVVRRPTGLLAEDLVTEIPPPWDSEDRLTVGWWRTRLGINHADLRRGGHDVFTGSGDIAEVIFAAREGHSAREVLQEITDQADKLFKQDRRARKVQLRLAAQDYQQAVIDRDGRLTRADAVVGQRRVVGELESKRRRARDDVIATSQDLKREEENRRVIESVLELRRTRSKLEDIDREGDRLAASELTEYDEAGAEFQRAEERIAKLNNEINGKTRSIEDLSVDDRLLDDQATLNRLQPDVKVRIEDLRRAGEEFGPAAADAATRLREQLRSIGIEAVDDLDMAVDGARVRADHAATLDDLADRIEGREEKRQEARDARDRALQELLANGVTVEVTTSRAPDTAAIGRLRKTLADARVKEATATKLLSEATDAVQDMLAGTHNPHSGAALTHAAVREARSNRDAQWSTIRRSWVTGELPASTERVDIAAELDKRLDEADKLADDEAVERSQVAALDARAEAHVEGLEAARLKQRSAEEALQRASDECRRFVGEWNATWADLGVATAPDIDNGSATAGLLSTVHTEQARDLSVTEQIAEINGTWRDAATLVGLPTVTTTAAWRKQREVLEEIEAIQAHRTQARDCEVQARGKWDQFVVEAVELLQRHSDFDEGLPVTPAIIEQGLEKLTRQLGAATAATAKRAAYREQIDEMCAERDDARQTRLAAIDSLQRLAETHSVDAGEDLDVLAQRARRAAEPLEHEAESTEAIKNGLGPGGDFLGVIARLEDHDEATVEQAFEEAQVRDREARAAADDILSEYTSARDRGAELEKAAGAADAEAVVAARQAEVARLTEEWAILALQRKLLEDVLDGLGSDDTSPLLDHAGELLEQLTGGRWVALRAEDDGVSQKLAVIRADNTPCDTSQLSEGTADQVFFALRLAAVAELHGERIKAGAQALPLLLDDVLMAFDEVRVKSALKILESLAPGLQVIVFTHHEHVAAAAGEFDQITVSRLPAPALIADPLEGDLIRAQK